MNPVVAAQVVSIFTRKMRAECAAIDAGFRKVMSATEANATDTEACVLGMAAGLREMRAHLGALDGALRQALLDLGESELQ